MRTRSAMAEPKSQHCHCSMWSLDGRPADRKHIRFAFPCVRRFYRLACICGMVFICVKPNEMRISLKGGREAVAAQIFAKCLPFCRSSCLPWCYVHQPFGVGRWEFGESRWAFDLNGNSLTPLLWRKLVAIDCTLLSIWT